MKPGCHKITSNAYHSGPGLSSSDLKHLIKSSAHWKQYKSEPIDQSKEMAIGSAVHALILEPEIFRNEFVVGDFNIRRGKEWDALRRAHPDKTIISQEEHSEAKRITEVFHVEQSKNPELKRLMEGHKELSFYWEDKATGILCKARPDNITPHGIIVDVKTARDASFDGFQKQMVELGYFISAAFYLRGLEQVAPKFIEKIPTEFAFIVIENKAPYAIAIYKLDLNALEFGRQIVNAALERYAEAVATDNWAGYKQEVVEMGLPGWATYRFNYLGVGK